MKRHWIKLYIEILNDPKMGTLPDYLWRRVVELCGFADKDGSLPPVDDLAWSLRVEKSALVESLHELSAIGLVYRVPNGWAMVRQEVFLFPKDKDYLTKRMAWLLVRKKKTSQVFARDGKVCAKCGTTNKPTIDHIKPLAAGGTNDLENLQVLCRSCNSSKGAKYG